ncbi:MAG TPA: hypothetical protein VNO18_14305 [Xanthobacteraceae bacterium]|nr:hypothetical protein [Xanthobacteraceae bacterium]
MDHHFDDIGGGSARERLEMLKVFLFLATATIAFFVTVETPATPEAGTHSDFEPATQVEMLQVNFLVHKLPARSVFRLV